MNSVRCDAPGGEVALRNSPSFCGAFRRGVTDMQDRRERERRATKISFEEFSEDGAT